MKFSTIASAIVILLSLALLTACTTVPNNMPLVFMEDISLGISMGGSTTSQGGELTLGFKSKDVAIIPVVTSASGVPMLIQGETTNVSGVESLSTKDAYSVLGQFNTTTNSATNQVGLGKFFATGQAAHKLAEGFADAMRADSESSASAVQAQR